jgi:hypothetical protein
MSRYDGSDDDAVSVSAKSKRSYFDDDFSQSFKNMNEKRRKTDSFAKESNRHVAKQISEHGRDKLGSLSSIVRATLTTPKFNEKCYETGAWSPEEVSQD